MINKGTAAKHAEYAIKHAEHATKHAEHATKHDEGKIRFDLIPPQPLWDLAEVYTIGEQKYSARNWEKGLPWGRVFAAVMRHLWAFWNGEDVDEEDGLSHLAHAAWGCFALLEYLRTHRELDDRSVMLDGRIVKGLAQRDASQQDASQAEEELPPVGHVDRFLKEGDRG
jgi:hypothetical protein